MTTPTYRPAPTARPDSPIVAQTSWPVSPAYSSHGGPILLLTADGTVLQIIHPPGEQPDYMEVIDPVVRELVRKKIELERAAREGKGTTRLREGAR